MIEGLKELIKSSSNQILGQCQSDTDIKDAYSKLVTGIDYMRMIVLLSLPEYNECYENINTSAKYAYERINGVNNNGNTNKEQA